MRKQYQTFEKCSFKYAIYLFHDGRLVETHEMWFGDEYISFIEDIEEQGYTKAYTVGEVEQALLRYEHMLANKLVTPEEDEQNESLGQECSTRKKQII